MPSHDELCICDQGMYSIDSRYLGTANTCLSTKGQQPFLYALCGAHYETVCYLALQYLTLCILATVCVN